MKLTIEPTGYFERIEGVEYRRWEGTDERGTPVHVWVRCVSPQTRDEEKLEAFDRDLQALPPAKKQAVVFDTRFVL